MGTYGNEVINATTFMIAGGSLAGPTSDVREQLRQIFEAASRYAPDLATGARGAVVYLPPRDYLIRRNPARSSRNFQDAINTADLLVPQTVTLWFAPGARFVMAGDVVVRIEGSIRAGVTQIFEGLVETSDTLRRGQVVFYSNRLLEVYPEWWGARSSPDDQIFSQPLDDTQALKDCIKAAHTDRVFASGHTYNPIPIVLRGVYTVREEIEVRAIGGRLRADGTPDLTDPQYTRSSGIPNTAGIVILGRKGVAGAQIGAPSFVAATRETPFSPTNTTPGVLQQRTGRALLRIEGIHGSVIEGVGFDGVDRATTCMQITGNNARSTVFRGCSFARATKVLAQVGDYVVVNEGAVLTTGTGTFRPLAEGFSGGWDLSGLLFEDCTFESGISIPDLVIEGQDMGPGRPGATSAEAAASVTARAAVMSRARAVSGLVFHANNTLPMTLDRCLFVGGMAACIEAYGGTMVVRGGGAQNQTVETPPPPPLAGPLLHRPRGGVDIFIGDPVLRSPGEAASPTGVTVIQFESQSNQFMDTFRHVSASAGRVAFYPTVLQSVSQRMTSPNVRAPPSLVWAGPGISSAERIDGLSAPFSTLTLVGCLFGGQRPGVAFDVVPTDSEPSGVLIIDSRAFQVGDVNTRTSFPSPGPFN